MNKQISDFLEKLQNENFKKNEEKRLENQPLYKNLIKEIDRIYDEKHKV